MRALQAGPRPNPRGQARLMDMTYMRIVFSLQAIPFVGLPFVVWLHLQGGDARALLAWTLGYACAAVAIRLQRRVYERERGLQSDDERVARWIPIIHRLALVHGGALALAPVVTLGKGSFEFALLLHISLAVILAANATHQTPVLGAFQRFFCACWGITIAITPWAFPTHWPFVLPLNLLFTVAIYRHALVANSFFTQQVRLEEEGAQLAERYRLAKEEAEQALRAKNQFLATASHDLRQPVHAMGFLVEAIAHRNRAPELAPALRDLRHSVRSVHLMFNSLLDLSKIESGALGLHRSVVRIAPLLDEVATLFREEAASRGLTLRVRLPRAGAAVLADAGLLRQSLVNLVHNALRYTRQGGLLLSARQRGEAGCDWLLEVWDTGIGVASDEQARIYSPFYRPELAWRIDSAGHGLGLAVVARCAVLMGATYGLKSVLGRGSRFWIRVPAAPPGAQDEAVGVPLQGAFTPLAGTCLVLEDDPQVAAAWAGLMQAWGVQVRCAASAAEAFEALDGGFAPQAILCDQRLRAGESGFEILQALLARCPDASGAMVSGEFASAELQQAEDDGYLVLGKPLDVRQLHALLTQWLRLAEPMPSQP